MQAFHTATDVAQADDRDDLFSTTADVVAANELDEQLDDATGAIADLYANGTIDESDASQLTAEVEAGRMARDLEEKQDALETVRERLQEHPAVTGEDIDEFDSRVGF